MTSRSFVGRFIAPATFTHLHYFVNASSYEGRLANFEKGLRRLEDRFNITKDKDIKEFVDNFLAKAREATTRLREDNKGLLQDVFGTRQRRSTLGALDFIGTVLSMGLSVSNRVAIEAIQDRLRGAEEEGQAVIAAVNSLAIGTDQRLYQVNGRINEIIRQHNNEVIKEKLDALQVITRRHLIAWHGELQAADAAFASLLQGRLHPFITPRPVLKAGMRELRRLVDKRGLQLVTWSSELHALYSSPVTVVARSGGVGLDIIVHVPAFPQLQDEMSLWAVRQFPLLLANHSLALHLQGEETAYVAVNKEGTSATDIGVSELATCERRQEVYLCRHSTFSVGFRTCATAIWSGNAVFIAARCDQFVAATPFHLFPAINGTVTIWSNSSTLLLEHCGNSTTQFYAAGLIVRNLPVGCRLEAPEAIVYRMPEEADLSTREMQLGALDDDVLAVLLEQEDPGLLAELLLTINDTRPTPLRILIQKRRRQEDEAMHSQAHLAFVVGSTVVVTILVAIATYLAWYCRRAVLRTMQGIVAGGRGVPVHDNSWEEDADWAREQAAYERETFRQATQVVSPLHYRHVVGTEPHVVGTAPPEPVYHHVGADQVVPRHEVMEAVPDPACRVRFRAPDGNEYEYLELAVVNHPNNNNVHNVDHHAGAQGGPPSHQEEE